MDKKKKKDETKVVLGDTYRGDDGSMCVRHVGVFMRPMEYESKLLSKTIQVVKADVRDIETVADTGVYVCISGWIQISRFQGKIAFLLLRDGTAPAVQVMVPKDVIACYKEQSQYLKREASVTIVGTVHKDKRAPTGIEVHTVDFEIVGRSAGIDQINDDTKTFERMENRHLVMREESTANVMKVRHYVTKYVREFFEAERFFEVCPPTITQGEVEGGSTLFKFKYYDKDACLTQSSQLYLETMIPIMKRVFCILPSFRAEKSRTRRHLSEYTHIEAEMAMISFDELLSFEERMIVYVCQRLVDDKESGSLVLGMNKGFSVPKLPFKRVRYSEAVKMLADMGVHCPDADVISGETHLYRYGDDIPDAMERKLLDVIGAPFFLTHFPHFMKSFYMDRDKDVIEETESADLIYPGCGEIIGGSMRLWDYEKLMKGFELNKLDASKYAFYTDQRKYGSVPHGGFGLGLERLVMCVCGLESIQEACMFPRYFGRCAP